ncbi:MAG: hypothetical protein ACI8PG_000146 [Planctomycetota bacterium]|jgi:hypothetical protein
MAAHVQIQIGPAQGLAVKSSGATNIGVPGVVVGRAVEQMPDIVPALSSAAETPALFECIGVPRTVRTTNRPSISSSSSAS